MLLNPYRFYVPSGIYDPDAESLFSRMTEQPPESLKIRIHNLITGLKFYALWLKIDALIIAKAMHTLQAALLDWRRNVSAEIIGTIFWNTGEGFINDGYDSSAVDTKFIPSVDGINYTLNSFSCGCYCVEYPFELNPGSGIPGTMFGVRTPITGSNYYMAVKAHLSAYTNSSGLIDAGYNSPYRTPGFFTLERTSDNNTNLYRSMQSIASGNSVPTGLPQRSVYLMAENGTLNNTPMDCSKGKEGFWYAGGVLSPLEKQILEDLINEFWLPDFSAENLIIPSTQYLEVGPSVIQPIETLDPSVNLLQVDYV